jgi:hypothetical protein
VCLTGNSFLDESGYIPRYWGAGITRLAARYGVNLNS